MARIQMLVFNPKKWNGRVNVDTRRFWEVATIRNTYWDGDIGETLATVEWEDGSVSTGHIVSAMKEVP